MSANILQTSLRWSLSTGALLAVHGAALAVQGAGSRITAEQFSDLDGNVHVASSVDSDVYPSHLPVAATTPRDGVRMRFSGYLSVAQAEERSYYVGAGGQSSSPRSRSTASWSTPATRLPATPRPT